MPATAPNETVAPGREHRNTLAALCFGALGIVYGDIGTSPLYAVKECFGPEGLPVTPENVLGIISLVLWALILVVVIKYLTFIMRADNGGEGGILALFALVVPRGPGQHDVVAHDAARDGADAVPTERIPARIRVLLVLGLFGAALLYGDGAITPAISVLSAIEGLDVATSAFRPFVVPLTVVILIALFIVQRKGTGGIGRVFGPLMMVWFVSIAALGVPAILRTPRILEAANPLLGLALLRTHGWHGFLVLGSVVLAVTGAEALYADMGHFGRLPIRVAWFVVVMPSLFLNYLGQGALLIRHGQSAAANPFYGLAPGWSLYPLVVLSTVAAVIASQALIAGVFSLTHQAVQLGYWPRVTITHTSSAEEGQIYVPEMNTALMVACVGLVLAFKESSRLAAAYGIAVTGTMTITSLLFYAVARSVWGWGRLRAGALLALFLVVDWSFLVANMHKVFEGGWVPLALAAVVFTTMLTWRRGRLDLSLALARELLPLDLFLKDVEETKPVRVKGTAVMMTADQTGTPLVLLHHYRHNKVLHEQVVLLSVVTRRVPLVPEAERVKVTPLGNKFYGVIASYGFMQHPDAVRIMEHCRAAGIEADPGDTSFFLGREEVVLTGASTMAHWRKRLFAYLSKGARPATVFFRIPPNRVVEIGSQIEL